jgi:EmrB/QacA subfamily drug resistance transporter
MKEVATKIEESAPPNRLDPAIWKVIGVVLLGPFMTQMDSTVVNVSLATIQHDLGATIAEAQWVISGYLLALALMLPLNGWIVDKFGAKKLYLACFAAFTLTSVLCGAAHTMNQLIFARALQGLAGGLLAPLTQMMIARAAGNQMARVVGYSAVPILIAPTIGPIVAGAVLKYAGWPWLFYLNLPIGILALILATILLPTDPPLHQKRSFDLLGFFTISPGLVCLLYGLEQATHGGDIKILACGTVLLGLFVWHAKRKKERALIDLDLFKNKIFAMATITQFFTNGVLYAGQFLIPLYLIRGCGFSSEKVGLILVPMGLGMMCIYPFMGYLTDKFGYRAVSVAGILLNVIGTLPFLFMIHTDISIVWIAVSLFVRGAGQGATGVPTIAAAYASVAKEKLGLATTAMNIVQRLGGPLATTITALVVSVSVDHAPADAHAFMIPFVVLIGLQTLVLGSASQLPVRISHKRQQT